MTIFLYVSVSGWSSVLPSLGVPLGTRGWRLDVLGARGWRGCRLFVRGWRGFLIGQINQGLPLEVVMHRRD